MKIHTAILAAALCAVTTTLPSCAQMSQSGHADIGNATGQKIGTADFCDGSRRRAH
jgi:hypothetical protein